MLPYIAVGLLLAVLTLLSAQGKWLTGSRYIALGVLIIFAGLRYQLGYDWLGYERLFEFVPDNWDVSQYGLSRSILATEPIYYLLNVAIKSIGGSFELLLLIFAVFNLIVIDRLVNKIAPGSAAFVWLIYFCVALLAVQFNLIRQAVASSFVIIALMKSSERRYWQAALWFVVGLGFHVSVIVFMPVFLVQNITPRPWHVAVSIGITVCLFGASQALGVRTLELVGGWLPEFIGSKTENYIQGFQSGAAFSGISPFAVLLVFAYLYLLTVFLKAERHVYINVAIYLTLLVLFAHVAFAEFPSLWNRIMCVSLPWQLACLWGIGYFRRLPAYARSSMLAVLATFSIGVMTYQLSRPESVPFVPYHSLAQVWLFGDQGDGRLRAEYTIQTANVQH